MADIEITYNNSAITLNESGTEVLETSGTYLTDDITVAYTKLIGSASTPATTITANPTISVNASGLITASVSGSKSVTPTVSAGYVSSGTSGTVSVNGGNTQQLTTQTAQTIMPTTSDQTIASGKYLTGTQTILGDQNLVAGNIKKDVVLFGVTGTLESGGGGGLVYETGTKRPASDTTSMSINFAQSHTNRPFCVIIADTNSKAAAEGSCLYWECVSLYDLFIAVPYSDTKSIYGSTKYVYRSSSSTSTVTSNQTSETALNTSVSSSGFTPNADTKYFRANRAYKWIAVWKPTT